MLNIKNSVSVVRVNVLLATDIACNDGKECVERKSGVSDAGMYISCLSPCRYPLVIVPEAKQGLAYTTEWCRASF